jgi:high affinity Mn2+ porin
MRSVYYFYVLSVCSLFANPVPADNVSVMNMLSAAGLHDQQTERWNFYGQGTYISSWKSGFAANYTNLGGTPNSLSPRAERSFTGTFTAFAGLRLWHGAELYAAPEVVSLLPLSNLHGLGGAIQNFELQKTGSISPIAYLSRVYLRQTVSLGEEHFTVPSGPLQLSGDQPRDRIVLTLGNLSVIDIFDKNTYSGDLRQQFFNMAFLTHASYDFAADARGYSWGIAGELYRGDWAVRLGRFIAPVHPNDLPLDFDIFRYYGDQIELEHRHFLFGQPGAIRLLAYRNHENMGRWDEAIRTYRQDPNRNAANCTGFNYNSANASAPDLCWVRRPNNKVGGGINIEQTLTADVGVFFRGMISDGDSEVYSYLSADRSVAFGTLVKGTRWQRPADTLGIGYALSWISSLHADYLNLGGVDGFIGDGRIRRGSEQVFDIFYNCHLAPSLWITADYQHITNPAYNRDRGPVDIYGLRGHIEF